MNRVWIIHLGNEQLTPGKLKELYLNKYPNTMKYQYGQPRFTRRAYFEGKHADHALRTLRQQYPELSDEFHVVEYGELK